MGWTKTKCGAPWRKFDFFCKNISFTRIKIKIMPAPLTSNALSKALVLQLVRIFGVNCSTMTSKSPFFRVSSSFFSTSESETDQTISVNTFILQLFFFITGKLVFHKAGFPLPKLILKWVVMIELAKVDFSLGFGLDSMKVSHKQ